MTESPLPVVLCTSGGLHGALVLDRLLASPHICVVGIVLSSRMLKAGDGFLRGAFGFARLCGLSYTLYLWCATTLADALLCHASIAPVAKQAKRKGIATLVTRRINDAAGVRFVESAAPDLLVSAFFNQRIDETLANLPRLGAVNIHPGLLPDCRGVDPVFHAMLQRQSELGVSVHRIAAEFDSGNVLASEAQAPAPLGSVWWNTARLYDRGGELLVGLLDEITRGVNGTPQPPGGRYDSWPTPAQVAALRRQGGKLVTMSDLWNVVRGRLPACRRETGRKING
jgi:methionyl-tRNA formyltransferase